MKKITEYIEHSSKSSSIDTYIKQQSRYNEQQEDLIDDQWINDEKPVKTADGRPAIVLDVDMKEIPNIIKGQVKFQTKLLDYEWQDDGICIKATDQYGNPKKPSEADNLVKDI